MATKTAIALQCGVSRAEQTAGKKKHLLQVAREQFVAQGYRSVTMEAIAQAAQVSKRSLYLWHEDKTALFKACLIEGARRFPVPDFNPDVTFVESLSIFGVSLLNEFAHPATLGMGRLLARESHEVAELQTTVLRTRDKYLVQPVAWHLTRIGLAGAAAHAAAELLIAMILAPVHSHLLMGSELPNAQAIEDHVAHVTHVFTAGSKAAE